MLSPSVSFRTKWKILFFQLKSGKLQVSLSGKGEVQGLHAVRDGNLYSLELKCGGSVGIVTRDVDASADVLIRFVSPSDHVIPSAVVKTLLHADEAA